ncbi:hypothetical protein CR513_17868, partial [Mucuna pruriens]
MDNVKLSRLELSGTKIVCLYSVCLHSAETKSDRSLLRSSRLSFCRVRLGQCRDESVLYTSASTSFHFTPNHNRAHCVLEKNQPRVDYTILFDARKMTKKELIKLAPLSGTQVVVSLCAKSSTDPLYAFDPEIELTLRRLRKIRNTIVNTSSGSDSAINSNLPSAEALVFSSNIFAELGQMENNDKILKELATPDVVYQPWCIQYPQLEPAQTYELKRRPPQASDGIPCGLLHNEAAGYIGRLHQNEGVPILSQRSSEGLAVSSANSFQHMGRHEAHISREVLFGIQNCVHQERDMLDKVAYKRDFARVLGKVQQTLCHLCTPQINERLLIQYFYEGLSMMEKSMIDAASGGALMDKTPAAVRHLISNMASNTQQFWIRGLSQSRMVNEIGAASNQRLENQLTELTSLVRQLAVGQHQPALAAKVCGICTSVEHPTDMCPALQETKSDQLENVGAYIHAEYLSKTNRLSTADSTISSTTFPTTVAVESAYPRQLSISGGHDEAACNQQPGVLAICELQ